MRLRNAGLLALALALPIAASAADPLVADGAWVRPAPPTARSAAVYLTVRNTSQQPEAIVGAVTPVAGRAELHETKFEKGIARMRPVAQLNVPAGGTAALAPGAVHLMLTDLHQPLVQGRHFPLTLRLASGREIGTDVAVTTSAHKSGGHATH